MVVDTSAFIAALTEPDGQLYTDALLSATRACASAFSIYETRVVLTGLRDGKARYRPIVLTTFLGLISQLSLEIVAFDAAQSVLAHQAYLKFGRGFHAAGLNLADCAAYALAQHRSEPLLFKGEDFDRTDVRPAFFGPGHYS
jgi:ribonuclease VapC